MRVQAYDIDNCKTIILHVGGNDADNGDDVDSFCDNYIALLASLTSDVRRLIVSGLLPRKKVDLETYNDQLKSLCDENDIEFIDHYQNFLLASGEIRASYFWKDKIHLNQHGTRKFLTNTDKVGKVKRSAVLDQDTVQAGRMQLGSRMGQGLPLVEVLARCRSSVTFALQVVITRMSIIIVEGTLKCKVDSINRKSMGA